MLDLTTSGSGPAHEFFRVADATVLSDGRIVVANSGTREIRTFSTAGAHLATVGREGDGPGEYRGFSNLDRLGGDTLGVISGSRLTVLGPDLAVVDVAHLPHLARWPHLLEDGRLVALEIYASMREFEGAARLIREPVSILLLDRNGVVEDTLWHGPGFEEFMFPFGETLTSASPLFGKGVSYGVRGLSLLVGTADGMEYEVLNTSGQVLQIVRVPGYDLSLDAATVAEERNVRLGPDPSPTLRRMIEQMPASDTRPAYDEFLIDTEGYLWAGEPIPLQRENAPRSWEVFSPAGEWLGSILTPARFELFEIGPDYLLGVFRDELDLEHVQLFQLARGGQ